MYHAFQMQRGHLEPSPSNTSLAASLMHAMYRSLAQSPYYSRNPVGSPQLLDFGLFVLSDDLRDAGAVRRTIAGFPDTVYADYAPGVSSITDPLIHDATQHADSDFDAFGHFWASVELVAEARCHRPTLIISDF